MASSDVEDLRAAFDKCCNFGVTGTGPKKTTLSDKNLTKWMKDASVYKNPFSSTDTDIAFSKHKEKGKKELTFAQFENLLKEVAPKYGKACKLDGDAAIEGLKKKLCSGGPSTKGTTGTSKTGGVAKMTDTSQYTGAHKERFDESGKGKGKSGRDDLVENTGYVGNYKGKDTFDDKK